MFTLIADKHNTSIPDDLADQAIWDIFYHMFLPESSLHVLKAQAKKLRNPSQSVDEWLKSPYGEFVKFLNQETLIQLSKYWSDYEAFSHSGDVDKAARGTVSERSEKIRNSVFYRGFRSAGPFWPKSFEVTSHLHRQYWKTGVAGGNSNDLELLGEGGKGFLNPMFAISSAPSGDFAVHYGTEPLLGFHLDEAFHKTNDSQRAQT